MVKYREILRLVAMGGEPGKRRVLLRVRGMTPSLLWNEYCDAAVSRGEEPYMYSAFCREYRAWAQAHVSMFAFFGGAAPVLVPDNCKTAASKNTKEALIVNEQYRRMSGHYGCAAVPARARRPRDKASVEMGVGLIERQAMLPLRSRRFMSLEELNAALADAGSRHQLAPFKDEEWLKQCKKHDTYRRSGVHAQADDGPRLEGKPVKTGGAVCPSLLSTIRGTAIAGAHSVYRRRVEQPPPRRTVRIWLYPS